MRHHFLWGKKESFGPILDQLGSYRVVYELNSRLCDLKKANNIFYINQANFIFYIIFIFFFSLQAAKCNMLVEKIQKDNGTN